MIDSVNRLQELHPSTLENAFAWFLRVVAGYCLLFGVLYWVRLIGLYDATLWRFDLMPLHWQVATATLAVFFPFAAIGLWMLSSWGPVIWFICAATETVMYAGFPDLFGGRPLIVVAHAVVALVYATFRVLLHLQQRRAAAQ
ncbi:DUF6163 family protein [Aminobacter sp. Piv2-1]|uniref:DUF6163 family protein n=1 Tax=Aminobacter sp. Piv2-1 TaxID=3031122 RepID=UPI0030ABCE03